MKPTLLLLGAILSASCFAQKIEVNYSEPIQVDSSAYFMIPELIDNDNRDAYGKGKGYLLGGAYRDIYFYNSATNQSKKLFGTTLSLISSFYSGRSYYYDRYSDDHDKMPENILPQHILYLARTADYNGDKALDSEDPAYLYLSTKTGGQLTKITPDGMNVVSWKLSTDKKLILVKLQQDKNGNRKFGQGDDDVYYRVDLHEDLSRVKCYPVPLP